MLDFEDQIIDCEFMSGVVSYLYNETDVNSREQFEQHMETCGVCTDEFATISNARLAVFEWNAEEFVPMQTPQIVIPYDSPAKQRETAGIAALIAGIRGLIAGISVSRAFAFAGMAAVLLITAVIVFKPFGDGNVGTERATGKESGAVAVPVVPAPEGDRAAGMPDEFAGVRNTQDRSSNDPLASPGPSVKAIKASQKIKNTQGTNPIRRNSTMAADDQQTGTRRKAPALTNVDDDDDKTLRLADLLDGVDG